MAEYEELIKALRCCGNVNTDCTVCPWDKYNFGMCAEKLYTDAAAAIEELQAEVRFWEAAVKGQEDGIKVLQAEVKRLKERNNKLHAELEKWVSAAEKAGEPKRGEWIVDGMYTYNLRELNGKAYEPVYRCSCCNRQMESYLRLDEPKMPEDADFPEYCPHCGAKMEVQE